MHKGIVFVAERPAKMKKKKILVCDDNMDILDITSMILEAEGFEVVTQVNSTALVAQALNERPDLMLLDLWMPFLPGDQLTRAIRHIPALANTPIIIFSAALHGKQMAAAAGANGFIEKPFDMHRLTRLITQTLGAAPALQ